MLGIDVAGTLRLVYKFGDAVKYFRIPLSDAIRDFREALIHGLERGHLAEPNKTYQQKSTSLSQAFSEFTPEEFQTLKVALSGGMLEEARGKLAPDVYQPLDVVVKGPAFSSMKRIEHHATHEIMAEEANLIKKTLLCHQSPALTSLANKIVMQGTPVEESDDLVMLQKIRDRVTSVWGVKTLVWQLAEFFYNHKWRVSFCEQLGPARTEGEPYEEQESDLVQVAQIKKLINGLYHLEHTAKGLEAEWTISAGDRLYSGLDDNTRWYNRVSDTARLLPAAPHLFNGNVTNIISHGYLAAKLLTSLDLTFVGGLNQEWLHISMLTEPNRTTNMLHWLSGLVTENARALIHRTGYIQGLMIDQLRPYRVGGVDLPVLTRVAEKCGEILSEQVSEVDKYFSDTDSMFALINNLASGNEEEQNLVAAFRDIVKEAVQANPSEEERRLRELNLIVANLSKAVGQIGHDAPSQLTNFIHYFSVLWYAFDLAREVSDRSITLSDSSKKALLKMVELLRNHYGSNLTILADKIEEVGLVSTGVLSKQALSLLTKPYKKLQSHTALNRQIPFCTLGPFESHIMIDKRLKAGQKRHQQYTIQASEIDSLFLPALENLMGPSAHTPADMAPKLFNILKPHIETVNPKLAQEMVRHWLKTGDYETDPTRYAGHEAYAALQQRLRQLKASHIYSAGLVTETIHHISSQHQRRVPPIMTPSQGQVRTLTSELQNEVDVVQVREVSARRSEGYLIWHPEDSEQNVLSEKSVLSRVKANLGSWYEYLDSNFNIDRNAPKHAPMSMDNVKTALKHVTKAVEGVGQVRDVPAPSIMHKAKYVRTFVECFMALIDGMSTALPFATEATNKYQAVRDYATNIGQKLVEPYADLSDDKDWAYRLMHHLLVAPEHIKTLGAGELTVDIPKPDELDRKAGDYSRQIGNLVRHGQLDYALLRYPALIMDGIRIFMTRQVYKNTFDQDALHAVKKLLKTTYDVTTEQGLLKLNKRVFLEMLRATDTLEAEMGLQTGELSNTVQGWIDVYRESLCEPLSLPSAMYFEILVDEASFMERWSGMGARAPSKARQDEIIEARRQYARHKNIDRALSLELIRIQKSESFYLDHAGDLFLDALGDALRPVMHAELKGEEEVIKRVHHRMYERSKRGLGVLEVYDKPKDGKHPQEGTIRLDAARAQLLLLKRFTSPTDMNMSWLLGQMEKFLNDESTAPSYRIQALHKLLSSDTLKQYMYEETTWFGLHGFGRFIAWVVTCCGYFQSPNPTIEGLDSLIDIANPKTLELQVFDRHYAADYRRLDAMISQIKAIEDYLDEVDKAFYYNHEHSLETEATLKQKRAHMQHLRMLASDKSESVQARIEAMRGYMLQRAFREDLLTYNPVESWFTFEAVKRMVLWLMSCVGLYAMPCSAEEQALLKASDPTTKYDKSALIDVSFFENKPVSDLERNYTHSSALEKINDPKPAFGLASV